MLKTTKPLLTAVTTAVFGTAIFASPLLKNTEKVMNDANGCGKFENEAEASFKKTRQPHSTKANKKTTIPIFF